MNLRRVDGVGHLLGVIHPPGEEDAALGGVEGGQLVGAEADDGHALCLQVLHGPGQVQNGLGAGTDHAHGGLAQLIEVGANVHGVLTVPVDAVLAMHLVTQTFTRTGTWKVKN